MLYQSNNDLLWLCGLTAPLKLRPYGAIQICLLLLLSWCLAAETNITATHGPM